MTTMLITGLPRSGTSLACTCLNALPDCVALVEPMNVPQHGNVGEAVEEISRFAANMRAQIISTGTARSATVNGAIPNNTFEKIGATGGLRRAIIRVTDVPIDKKLTPDFRLFLKHPALFTALAQPLMERFQLYAFIRHPLAVLASWQTVDASIHDGRWPPAEAYSQELRRELECIGPSLDRQIALIGWIFRVYRGLPASHVIRYESLVQDPNMVLAPLSGINVPVTHDIAVFTPQKRYLGIDLSRLAGALLAIESDVNPFYPDFAASLRSYIGHRGRDATK